MTNKSFLKLSVFITICLMSSVGCAEKVKVKERSSCEDIRKEVVALEIMTGEEEDFSKERASQLMRLYAEFSNVCPNDSLTPEYLMRRADLLRGAGKINEAIRLFQAIHDGYPHFSNRPLCALLTGYLYETELGDYDMAEKMYRGVIEIHPKSHEAEVASISLKHLGESPEEWLRKHEKSSE